MQENRLTGKFDVCVYVYIYIYIHKINLRLGMDLAKDLVAPEGGNTKNIEKLRPV